MQRTVTQRVTGYDTQDGAGVKLVRVLGNQTVGAYDPILMLDSFDSTDSNDWIAGFPMHPHRGIETVSYIYRGAMTHRDSLGNEDTIADGEVQWMTAGSGILHEEMPPAGDRILGVQLWLNLPAKDKMCPPVYHSIKNADIQEIAFEGGMLRLLAGSYGDAQGFQSKHVPFTYYDVHLQPGASLTIEGDFDDSVMVFTLVGDAEVAGEAVAEKTAVKLSAGETVTLRAPAAPAQILYIASKRLDEAVYWGGPIVMDTSEGLRAAFADLDNGTFLKDGIDYEG